MMVVNDFTLYNLYFYGNSLMKLLVKLKVITTFLSLTSLQKNDQSCNLNQVSHKVKRILLLQAHPFRNEILTIKKQ